MEDIEDTDN